MAKEKRLIWDEDAKRHLIALAIGHHSETLHIDMILNAILHHTPTVDAVEVVHGRWARKQIGKYTGADEVCCSVCGCWIGVVSSDTGFREAIEGMNYFPNCGAKMDGDGNA